MLHYALITSAGCPAGRNIRERLLEQASWSRTGEDFDGTSVLGLDREGTSIRLYRSETLHIHCESIDERIEADIYIFCTTHRSENGTPSLSVHAPGNWGPADLGGRPRELVPAAPSLMRACLLALERLNTLPGFEVVQEATHHGPYLRKPAMFIEIGSSEREWGRDDAGAIIAKALLEVLPDPLPAARCAFGIGGLHTTPNFRNLVLRGGIALGHCCPKYNLGNLDGRMLGQAMERSAEPCGLILLDWKAMGGHKERIAALVESYRKEHPGTEVQKVKEMKRGLGI
ncbi:hypothetical protein JXB02_06010 [Candidatus Woesearchaeota archaeon]|nr:hypothetical protein [Candidatus Woesearchaeota archaeon]